MAIDVSKLEKVKRRGSLLTARCPACAESGGDREGKHLFIAGDGRFGCALYPGETGREHRKRIFALAGERNSFHATDKRFEVRRPAPEDNRILQEDILGRLGRVFSSHAHIEKKDPIHARHNYKELELSVPSVPDPEIDGRGGLFSKAEEEMLAGLDVGSLEVIRLVKNLFGATVISSDDIREAVDNGLLKTEDEGAMQKLTVLSIPEAASPIPTPETIFRSVGNACPAEEPGSRTRPDNGDYPEENVACQGVEASRTIGHGEDNTPTFFTALEGK